MARNVTALQKRAATRMAAAWGSSVVRAVSGARRHSARGISAPHLLRTSVSMFDTAFLCVGWHHLRAFNAQKTVKIRTYQVIFGCGDRDAMYDIDGDIGKRSYVCARQCSLCLSRYYSAVTSLRIVC